jgi:hypothetical protein
VGATPGNFGGFDTIKLGAQSLAGKVSQTTLATTNGGAYSDYGSAFGGSAVPACIVVPRYQFASPSSNANTATPQYLVASSVLDGNEGLWKVTASGATFTDITPNNGGNYGVVISANALAVAWTDSNIFAGLFKFGSSAYRLYTSANAGTGWSDRGVVGSDAAYLRMRRTDISEQELYYVDGDAWYSPNRGATKSQRTMPTSDPIILCEIFEG